VSLCRERREDGGLILWERQRDLILMVRLEGSSDVPDGLAVGAPQLTL
jgi:hypothetical protein